MSDDSSPDLSPSGGFRVMRPRRAQPASAVRPTRAEVDLGALRENFYALQDLAADTAVWGVLKADGYGHGAPAIARTLERCGAKGFCVALLEEAIELRDAGIQSPILVMGGYYGRAHDELIARNLTPVIYDEGHIEGFTQALRKMQDAPTRLGVHVKVDTGMARLGVRPERLGSFAARLREHPELVVEGLMTHLAQADASTLEVSAAQLRRFDSATAELAQLGVRARVRHAGNSAALLRGDAMLDAIRPGLALFGVAPPVPQPEEGTAPRDLSLRLTMRVRTEVVDVRNIEPGDSIGYGGTFTATRRSRIATVAMGYADGLPRAYGPLGEMLVRGTRAKIAGTVSMDMTMLDVTEVPDVEVGDEVVVMGRQEGAHGKGFIDAQEIAERAGQIPWEVLTQISRRVPRFYRDP